jgi:putative ABC transport system ATP-binding protein
VLALLRRYHDDGQTMVLVTHDARVASVADRILTMRDGRIIDETSMSATDPSGGTLAQLIQMEV